MARGTGARRDPDLGVLAANLLSGLRGELSRRAAASGFGDLTPRHVAVLAHLDEDGIRPSELARLSGRHKQTIGTILDELEGLGYLRREPDPVDRRAKLITPTERGLALLRVADGLMAEIEARHRVALGELVYDQFKAVLRDIASIPTHPVPVGPGE